MLRHWDTSLIISHSSKFAIGSAVTTNPTFSHSRDRSRQQKAPHVVICIIISHSHYRLWRACVYKRRSSVGEEGTWCSSRRRRKKRRFTSTISNSQFQTCIRARIIWKVSFFGLDVLLTSKCNLYSGHSPSTRALQVYCTMYQYCSTYSMHLFLKAHEAIEFNSISSSRIFGSLISSGRISGFYSGSNVNSTQYSSTKEDTEDAKPIEIRVRGMLSVSLHDVMTEKDACDDLRIDGSDEYNTT